MLHPALEDVNDFGQIVLLFHLIEIGLGHDRSIHRIVDIAKEGRASLLSGHGCRDAEGGSFAGFQYALHRFQCIPAPHHRAEFVPRNCAVPDTVVDLDASDLVVKCWVPVNALE